MLDRKSTRLNSSHSLHDALPICLAQRVEALAHGRGGQHQAHTRLLVALDGVLRHVEAGHARSEEHTSELQSLPTRRSSDLPCPACRGSCSWAWWPTPGPHAFVGRAGWCSSPCRSRPC